MVAGREVTPGDVRATERLKRYWTEGEGAARIGWGVPGDFYRCLAEVGSEETGMSADALKGYCSNLHERALGVRPGREGGHHGR